MIPSSRVKKRVLQSLFNSVAVSVLLLATVSPVEAKKFCNVQPCETQTRGADLDNATTDQLPIGKNTERETVPNTGGAMFSISVEKRCSMTQRKHMQNKR